MKTIAKQNYHKRFNRYYSSKAHMWWRDAIRARDKVCQDCLVRGVVTEGVEVHHIVPIETDFTKRLELSNGVLLCKSCHDGYHEKRQSELSKYFSTPPDKVKNQVLRNAQCK